MVAPGERVAGRFVVESTLAEGGPRNKYLATDERRGQPVVLEVLPGTYLPEQAERFRSAMSAASAVGHPALTEVHDVGVETGVGAWLCSHPLEGQPLSARLGQGAMAAAELIPIAQEILSALVAAHERGVLHLGVQPAEVFLERRPEGARARLLGLGACASLDPTRAPVASIPWLAPELASGEATDVRTDVYGVGALLYGALSGSAPYAAQTVGELVRTMYTAGPPPLSARAPTVSAELAALVDRCLSVDPAARPASAGELRDLLAALSEGTPRTMALDAAQLQSQIAASQGGWHPSPQQAPLIGGTPAGPTAPSPVPVATPQSAGGGGGKYLVIALVVAAVGVLGVMALMVAGGVAAFVMMSDDPTPPAEVYVPPLPPPPPPALDDPRLADNGPDRAFLPLTSDMPSRGAADALVTVVVFSDFQCPFCRRVEPTLERLVAAYPNDLRVVWRDHPLPFHQNAMPAAALAREAYAQGGDARFWQAHDLLFENNRELDRANLLRFGDQLGLEPTRVRIALDDNVHSAHINADAQAAQALGARGTPAFFINGRPLVGAQPYERFTAIVDEELASARSLLAQGVPRNQVYTRLTQNGRRGPAPEDAAPSRPARRRPDPAAIYRVPIGDAPVLGPSDALVTVVVFSEFQCPFCNRVRSTLDQVRQRYGNDVRIVFMHNPLAFHDNAMPAAEAASEVYARRGSEAFFRYHDRLFENQRELTRANLVRWARDVGVSVGGALDDHRHRAAIEEQQRLARSLGASGTPNFFINGRNLRGAQPFAAFERVIDEELVRARAELARGTPRSRLYTALIQDGATSEQLAP